LRLVTLKGRNRKLPTRPVVALEDTLKPDELYDFLRKKEQFDSHDLQTLREGLSESTAALNTPANVAWLNSRLSLETITAMRDLNESIRKLDATSTDLDSQTNHLTKVILWVTLAAVLFAGVQVIVAVLQFHH
jgi:hypothetical protein